MVTQHVTLMITSTFYDMFSEYYYFITEVFPYLKEFCAKHDIILYYRDVAFSMLNDYTDKSIILDDFRSIDFDRTFFICFRGHKLGWKPNYKNVNELTIDEYPEIIKFVGNVSITELSIMHALHPFDKFENDELEELYPSKHALFYFRDGKFIDGLSKTQKMFYTNMGNNDNKKVNDMEIAKAKDLIYEVKREYDKNGKADINIRYYKGSWNKDLDGHEIFLKYADEYSRLTNMNLDMFIKTHEINMCYDYHGSLDNLECEGKPLKEILIHDIIEGLKKEFPENFKE